MGACIDQESLEQDLAADLKYACPDFSIVHTPQTARYQANQRSRFDPAYYSEFFWAIVAGGLEICHKRSQSCRQARKLEGDRVDKLETLSLREATVAQKKDLPADELSVGQGDDKSVGAADLQDASAGRPQANRMQPPPHRGTFKQPQGRVFKLARKLCIKEIARDFEVAEQLVAQIASVLRLGSFLAHRDFVQMCYVMYNIYYVQECQFAVFYFFADDLFNFHCKTRYLNKVLWKCRKYVLRTAERTLTLEQFRANAPNERALLNFAMPLPRREENSFGELSHFTDISYDKAREKRRRAIQKLADSLGDQAARDAAALEKNYELQLEPGDDGFSALFDESVPVW